MFISEFYRSKKPVVSLEIFPPKKDNPVESIYNTIEELSALKPDFISVTYSAGGVGTSEKTAEIASAVKNKYGIEALAHMTCIRLDRAQVASFVENLKQNNIQNILGLRGDIPEGLDPRDLPGDFRFARDLIAEISGNYPEICIGAAAYPEGHIECESLEKDIEHLKLKVEAGAKFLITQLFFDNELFYRFYEMALKKGVNIPISAGIMPILSKSQIQKMIFMCGASLPAAIVKILNRYEHDPEGLIDAGIEYSCRQINDLIDNGVDGVHIYTMNRPEIAKRSIAAINRR
ncbi:MAG TPA: methylenetetrahydrofolate reductase [NAD(P)H] [Clostridiales bacterium]|nr:methylenetetrahydrofolate reductase [NAD(P)H] [Clostridiales bacterium]